MWDVVGFILTLSLHPPSNIKEMLAATDAIVLRSRKQGDTSKIVSLYTREFGLVDVIAKGARQLRSKFGAALEPFTESKVVFYKKEHHNLYLLSNAEVHRAHRNLTADLEHIEAATRIAEILIRTQRHEEKQTELFDLVARVLDLIDSNEAVHVWAILFSFYLRYAALAGFAVTVGNDRDTARALYFDAERGEIIALDGESDPFSERFIPITKEMFAALAYLDSYPIDSVSSLRLSPDAKRGLDALFRSYFAYHLEGMQRGRTKVEKVFNSMKGRK